ncbi:MAG: stage III sporulation protein AF [Tyzzerella sp.]|uniref:Stage III sporulation protein AF n=1 Tax=Candidatus Fimicola merdigallinarum TaxID=2840819 RepID=A0A9D9DYX0_9FIRM|nr:stage III sporulation protein AF [Candidatus Fimicola merdigallinarum]
MLEDFKAYIKVIAVFMIFVSFAEILFPEGSLKKFVNIFTGLIIIAVALNPLINFVNKDIKINYSYGKIYDEDMKDFAMDIYNEKAKEDIEAFVHNFSDGKARAVVSGESVTIICDSEYDGNDIFNMVSDMYEIDNVVLKTNE